MDAALAGVDSPDPSPTAQPSVPRPVIPIEQPPPGTPQPGVPTKSPGEPPPAAAMQPTTPPGPKLQPRTEPMSKTRPRKSATEWSTRSGWLPRPESLCWRCGVPGHFRGDCRTLMLLFCSRSGTMGLLFRDCPCPQPPAAPLTRVAAPPPHAGTPQTPRNVQRPRSQRRARCAATADDNAAVTVANTDQTTTREFICYSHHLI
jgi:hypothetical protein